VRPIDDPKEIGELLEAPNDQARTEKDAPWLNGREERRMVDATRLDPNSEEFTTTIALIALPLLVERLGGTVEITEAELDALGERHGGIRRVGTRIEKTANGFRLTIVRKDRPPLS
jgi:hypothetical protein